MTSLDVLLILTGSGTAAVLIAWIFDQFGPPPTKGVL